MEELMVPMLQVVLHAFINIHNQKIHLLQAALHRRNYRRRQQRLKRAMVLRQIVRHMSSVPRANPQPHCWWDAIVPDLSPQQFLQNFCVSRESFHYINDRTKLIMAKMDSTHGLHVPFQKRVGIALWKLATGNESRTISHLFGVDLTTVFICVQQFCDAVIRVLLPLHLKMPDARKLREMATHFHRHWRAPQCVGVINCSHIPVNPPTDSPTDYCNSKGWSSIVLQAVVDGKGLFWDVCVGFPGSSHETRVLYQSHLWEDLKDGQKLGQNKITISGCDVGHYLIGEPAYPLQRWIMKTFSNSDRLTPEQETYNRRLKRVLMVMERAFGRLKERWRSLLVRNDCKLELTKKMALTCCVLHNICEEQGDNLTEELPYKHATIQPSIQELPEYGDSEGTDIRAALMDYFVCTDK